MLSEFIKYSSPIKSTTNIYSDLSGLWIEFFSELILGERTLSIITYLLVRMLKLLLPEKDYKVKFPC